MLSRGDIWKIDWSRDGDASEPSRLGYGVVIQNDHGNAASGYPFTLVATVGEGNREIPFHVPLSPGLSHGLPSNLCVRCEQVLMIQKSRLVGSRLGRLNDEDLRQVGEAIKVSLGLQ
jgi:mRNA-degrading endonuclease toxin of MazEF toxin-antitoxin module